MAFLSFRNNFRYTQFLKSYNVQRECFLRTWELVFQVGAGFLRGIDHMSLHLGIQKSRNKGVGVIVREINKLRSIIRIRQSFFPPKIRVITCMSLNGVWRNKRYAFYILVFLNFFSWCRTQFYRG